MPKHEHKPDRGNPPLPFLESGWTKKQLRSIDQAYDAIISIREDPTSIKSANKFIKTAKAYADGEVTLRNMRETMITGPEFKRLTAQSISIVIIDAIVNENLHVAEIITMLQKKEEK